MIRTLILFTALSSLVNFSQAQITKKALFIGNSYTSYNNLPQLVKDAAASVGDNLIIDANMPGGQTLQQHTTNANTISKIQAGGWDFVVLQEQSQIPSFPEGQVAPLMYPAARYLDSTINASNVCAETIFYMTWGRKNGDAANCPNFTPLCTYRGMDSLIQKRYRYVAEQNNAILSPAGAVWRYLIENHPTLELYSPDESHPSLAGSYAAACAFYTTIFKKDPTLITFNSSLGAADAEIIRNAAKLVVFNNQTEWLFDRYNAVANFDYTIQNAEVTFNNTSAYSESFDWNFGDGDSSTDTSPVYTFNSAGNHTVSLMAGNCSGFRDTIWKTINITTLNVNPLDKNVNFSLYPNPAQDFITIISNESTESAYQILNAKGKLIQVGKMNLESKTIDIRSLHAGVYFIQLEGQAPIQIQFIKK